MNKLVAGFIALVATATLEGCQNLAEGETSSGNAAFVGDGIIVPGERVGPFRLGMTETELLALGRPDFEQARAIKRGSNDSPWLPATYYCFDNKIVCVDVEQSTSKVVAIDLGYHGDCGPFRTADGITCGLDYDKLTQSIAMGRPDFTLTFRNPFHNNRIMSVGFRSPLGNVTKVRFSKDGSSMADSPVNSIQGFYIEDAGLAH